MSRLPHQLQRYGTELVIVFLGVFLGLLAEGWRERRIEMRAEHESLDRLYGDMLLDEQDMRLNSRQTEAGLSAARWLIANAGSTHSPDSVSTALTNLGVCSFFVPYQSEYTALKSSGKLALLSNDTVREQIVRLYEEQPFIEWLHERDCLMTSEIMDAFVGRFDFEEPAQRRGATRFPRVVFQPGQEEMLRDPQLKGMLVRLATQRQYLVAQIERRRRSMERVRAQIESLVPGVENRPRRVPGPFPDSLGIRRGQMGDTVAFQPRFNRDSIFRRNGRGDSVPPR